MQLFSLVSFQSISEIKVNNLTPYCVENFIYPLEVFKCDSVEPNILNKSQNLLLKAFIENALSTAYYPFHTR